MRSYLINIVVKYHCRQRCLRPCKAVFTSNVNSLVRMLVIRGARSFRASVSPQSKFHCIRTVRLLCIQAQDAVDKRPSTVTVLGKPYQVDSWTNITPSILNKVGKNLHNRESHPLCLLKKRISNYFYEYRRSRGNPLFSVYDNLSPVVTLEQNFDHLLVPKDHISRVPSESYYLNSGLMLRAHCTAHQKDLVKSGLDAFLMVGDVYRRDAIDASHYPVFHQLDGVRLFNEHELFSRATDPTDLHLFEKGTHQTDKQAVHTLETALLLEQDLKRTLEKMAYTIFGQDIEIRWVDAYFPFTHPSWEMEIKYQDKWMEVLGCGVMAQQILDTAGASDKAGWAFGLGLERLAMKLYNIPDIRVFWSEDRGFLSQFKGASPDTKIEYKSVSKFPVNIMDMSFWVPEEYVENDFYDLVRNIGGDIVEQVDLIDDFVHPKTKQRSHCYRISYRHMEKALTNEEVNEIHRKIKLAIGSELGAELRGV